jgi:ABC-type transport system involved in cytochrome bd biosynthesis fused ATPase/permease subunit
MLQRLHTQSRVVIMDEPTAHLDSDTVALVHEVMEEAFLECTVLTAAESEHALPTVEMLIGLDDGGIEFVD